MHMFIVRVLLHKKTSENEVPISAYDALHEKMATRRFYREIEDDDGVMYKMLPAEYIKQTEADLSSGDILDQVDKIIVGLKFGRKHAIFCTKAEDLGWMGLDPV